MSEEKEQEKKKDDRVRNITFIIYPDSCAADWKEQLVHLGEKGFVSPLHDKDVTGEGTPKKPHRHVLVMFKGKQSDEQVKSLVENIGGVLAPNKRTNKMGPGWAVSNTIGLARYFCHLDDADKARYDTTEVISLGGLDYATYLAEHTNNDAVLDEILQFVSDYHVYSFMKLCMYAKKKQPAWSYVLKHSGAYYIKEAIKSNFFDESLQGRNADSQREAIIVSEGKEDPFKEV